MIERGNKSREEYPELQRCYTAYEVKCILGRENGSCFLSYDGYIKGTYSNPNLAKVFNCFVKTIGELPITVSFDLENRIKETDEHHSLLSFAMEAINKQREHLLSALNPASKKKI